MESLLTNRRAKFDYFLSDEIEAGIMLVGSEVKSLRAGRANIQDAHISIHAGEAWIYNFSIEPYDGANIMNHDPRRRKKLLLHKKEISRLSSKVNQAGFTIIPTKVYLSPAGRVKVEIALGKGKKLHDKRQVIKERDALRELRNV